MARVVLALLALPLASAFLASPFKAPVRRTARAAMEMRTPIMAGNWKMNPAELSDAVELAKGVAAASTNPPCEVVVTPPYPFLSEVKTALGDSPVQLASQEIYFEDKGAYTGAIAGSMIKSVGCQYVLAGHSERRTVFGDDDAAINKKVLKILSSGLGCILCIGESLAEYESGLVNEICNVQLAKCLAGVSEADMANVVIAYEPVWAIGTGLVCPSETAQKVHEGLRAYIGKLYSPAVAEATRIQYGGSVTPESVDELMSMPDIDGCLVGGASLVADKFARIVNFEAK